MNLFNVGICLLDEDDNVVASTKLITPTWAYNPELVEESLGLKADEAASELLSDQMKLCISPKIIQDMVTEFRKKDNE